LPSKDTQLQQKNGQIQQQSKELEEKDLQLNKQHRKLSVRKRKKKLCMFELHVTMTCLMVGRRAEEGCRQRWRLD